MVPTACAWAVVAVALSAATARTQNATRRVMPIDFIDCLLECVNELEARERVHANRERQASSDDARSPSFYEWATMRFTSGLRRVVIRRERRVLRPIRDVLVIGQRAP